MNGVTRTNVFHLPVRGTGDGGIYTTVADISSFWARSSPAGSCRRTGSPRWCARAASAGGVRRYGLGFWLHPTSDAVMLVGCDAGVSFRSVHDPPAAITYTVISNSTHGAWPVLRLLLNRFSP